MRHHICDLTKVKDFAVGGTAPEGGRLCLSSVPRPSPVSPSYIPIFLLLFFRVSCQSSKPLKHVPETLWRYSNVPCPADSNTIRRNYECLKQQRQNWGTRWVNTENIQKNSPDDWCLNYSCCTNSGLICQGRWREQELVCLPVVLTSEFWQAQHESFYLTAAAVTYGNALHGLTCICLKFLFWLRLKSLRRRQRGGLMKSEVS